MPGLVGCGRRMVIAFGIERDFDCLSQQRGRARVLAATCPDLLT